MQYGYLGIEREFISNYMGSNEESTRHQQAPAKPYPSLLSSPVTVSQRDATLLYLQDKVRRLTFLIISILQHCSKDTPLIKDVSVDQEGSRRFS